MTPPTTKDRPWLFEAFPQLRRNLKWTHLVEAPTPVQKLENLSQQLETNLWVKRDDKTSPLYGGNKARKLEFLLADSLSLGKRTLVTGGGLGTNHGLATAIFGGSLGFRVLLGLFDQPVTEHVRRNLLLFYVHGAEMLYAGPLWKAVIRFYVTERIRRPGAYFIEPGGSSPLGVLGYVDAGLELARQVKHGEMPMPKLIFVPVGTCGTMAGLVLGLKLAGLPTKVMGVQVAPGLFASSRAVLRLAQKTLRLLRNNDSSVPEIELAAQDVPVGSDYYGRGYGHPTEAGRSALKLMAEAESINLDLTYTAKAFGAMLDYVKTRSPEEPILFWNTFNSVDLSPVLKKTTYKSLPRSFHRFFEGEVVA
jgi:D-cysteine desulfhydrase